MDYTTGILFLISNQNIPTQLIKIHESNGIFASSVEKPIVLYTTASGGNESSVINCDPSTGIQLITDSSNGVVVSRSSLDLCGNPIKNIGSIYDISGTSGSSNQILTAGSAGRSVRWSDNNASGMYYASTAQDISAGTSNPVALLCPSATTWTTSGYIDISDASGSSFLVKQTGLYNLTSQVQLTANALSPANNSFQLRISLTRPSVSGTAETILAETHTIVGTTAKGYQCTGLYELRANDRVQIYLDVTLPLTGEEKLTVNPQSGFSNNTFWSWQFLRPTI